MPKFSRKECMMGMFSCFLVMAVGILLFAITMPVGIALVAIGFIGECTFIVFSPVAYCPKCNKRIYAQMKTPEVFTVMDHGLCPICGSTLEFRTNTGD